MNHKKLKNKSNLSAAKRSSNNSGVQSSQAVVGSMIASDKVRFSWIFVFRLATKVKSTSIEDHVKRFVEILMLYLKNSVLSFQDTDRLSSGCLWNARMTF